MTIFKRALLLIVVIVIAYMVAYPSYSWHQKMTIEVETPEGLVSGSSVVAVKWSSQPELLAEIQPFYNEMHGEAVVVALPDGKYIFARLGNYRNESYTQNLATQILYDTTKRERSKEAFRRVTKHDEPMLVPQKLYPPLVTFTNVNDPTTVKHVDLDDLAATFGEGYSLKSITLEITDEPVTRGRVEEVLNWLFKDGRGGAFFIDHETAYATILERKKQ